MATNANTLKGRKIYVCATAKPDDLTQSDYAALTWVEVGSAGSIGETGTKDNIVTYDTLGDDVTSKGKGISNAGDPTIEVARKESDAGQIIMRTIAKTVVEYAFKITDDDAPAGYTPTTYYNRAIVGGPTRPNGRNESFDLEVYMLGCVQKEIVVDPAALSVPTIIAGFAHLPSIIGLADISSGGFTADEGDWTNSPTSYTYQWQRDTAGNHTYVDIAGATTKGHTLVGGDSGNSVRVGVKAVNGAGTAVAFSYSAGSELVVA